VLVLLVATRTLNESDGWPAGQGECDDAKGEAEKL